MIKFHIVSPGEECAPELLQVAKGFCSVHTEHVAWRLALLVAVAANDQFTTKYTNTNTQMHKYANTLSMMSGVLPSSLIVVVVNAQFALVQP